MNVTIENTILVNRHEIARQYSIKDKVLLYLCCYRPPPTTTTIPDRHAQRMKRRASSRVRFKEPNKVEPIDDREPSWESYRSWSSRDLDNALEEFINETLETARKTLENIPTNAADLEYTKSESSHSDKVTF